MNLLDFLRDEESQRAMARGLLDAGNRGIVGGLLGAPVDATTGVVNAGLMAGGYLGNKLGLLSADQMPQPITEPVGGSEWFGNKMQEVGLVSPARNALAEGLASFASPLAALRAGPATFQAENALLRNLENAPASPVAGSLRAQRGSIGLDINAQVDEIMNGLALVPKGERVGLRLLPDDVPTPGLGSALRPSRRWIDGVQTDKELPGTSSIDLGKGTLEEIERAVKLLGLYRKNGYYPGNKLAVISGPSKRKGEDAGESMIRGAVVRWMADPPLGPR